MEEMRQTLSFSIIKILGTEVASGGKDPRLAGDDAAEDRAVSSSPSNTSSYEMELQTCNRLETGTITMFYKAQYLQGIYILFYYTLSSENC